MKLVAQNDMSLLVDLLVADYRQAKNSLGVFGPYTIAVPNRSIENWLSAQIVHRVGIVSGIRFESLHKLLGMIYQRSTDIPADLVDKNQLSGLLFGILTEIKSRDMADGDALIIPKRWLSKQKHPQAIANFSHALADLFELYQIYRTDWLDSWAEDKSEIGSEAERWQAEIWRKILKLLPETFLRHREQLTDAFEVSAKQQGFVQSLGGLQQISVFGVNQIDAVTLRLLQLLGKQVPVRVFWQTPSISLLGHATSIETNQLLVEKQEPYFSDNPLLASWGALSRQQFILFEKQNVTFNEPEPNLNSLNRDLLSIVRAGIINNSEVQTLDSALDESISINSHFSRYREIEGLHDYLLERLNQDLELKPHDILVLCPDINEYASYIHAVFENQPFKKKIPYQLCGVNSQASDLATVALELAMLPETRYNLSDIIDLLNHPYIRKKFELGVDEVEQIHTWFKQANVFWGLDKTTLTQLNLPEYDRYTLQCGIDRMVLGSSLDGKSLSLGDRLMYGIEGMSALQSGTLSKLIAFIDELAEWRDKCLKAGGEQHSYSIGDWCEQLRTLTETFIEVTHTELESLNKWYRSLSDLEHSFLEDDQPSVYSYSFIKNLLAQKVLDDAVASSSYQYGKVNLGAFGSLKSIPAKIIACLGMNESDFPRKPLVDGMNLTLQVKRLGDRSPVEQDKDAFLMAMLNCQSYFYCSYVGKDMRSDNERNPSILLQELMDYIQPEVNKQRALTGFHPMKPYSDAYFKPGSHLFTYQDFTDNSSSNAVKLKPPIQDCFSEWVMPEQLSIQDLKVFLEDPAKSFFKVRFNVDLPDLDEDITDVEPFAANSLTRWKFIDELLRLGLQQGEITKDVVDAVGEPYQASGMMEHDLLAEKTLGEWADTACKILENALKAKGQKKPESLPVDLLVSVDSQNIKLVGDLDVFSGEGSTDIIQLAHKKASEVSEKYLMRAIVDARIAEAMKFDGKVDFHRTFLACEDGVYLLSADYKSGRASLQDWVKLYKTVMTAPIALDLVSAKQIKNDLPYREAFEQMLESASSSYLPVRFSEAFKLLSHDHAAIEQSEVYLVNYQYLKPGKPPDEDQHAPFWEKV